MPEFDKDFCRELVIAARDHEEQAFLKLLGPEYDKLDILTPFGTPISLAVKHNWTDMVKQLLGRGCDVEARYRHSVDRPLGIAISNGNREIVQMLLRYGAKIETDSPEDDCFLRAIQLGDVPLVGMLLEAGGNPHVVHELESGRKRNALSFAKEWGRTEIVEMLEAAGCQMPDNSIKLDHPEKDVEYLIHVMEETYGDVSPLALTSVIPELGAEGVAIHLIRENQVEECMTLFTTGMSHQAMNLPAGEDDYQFAELMIHLPLEWPLPEDLSQASDEALWPLKWMLKIAAYPHQANTWLGGKTTIISNEDPPQPLGPGTDFTCLLLLADFARFSPFHLPSQKLLHIYSLLPIFTEERDLERRKGMGELLSRFSKKRIPKYVEECRKNVGI